VRYSTVFDGDAQDRPEELARQAECGAPERRSHPRAATLVENCEAVAGIAATHVHATPDLMMGELLKMMGELLKNMRSASRPARRTIRSVTRSVVGVEEPRGHVASIAVPRPGTKALWEAE
jgi:hypothetical protein